MRQKHWEPYLERMDPGGELPSRELRVFLALAEDPHFGRASARLFLSQPYVSRTLAAFERRMGGQLIDRAGHRLTPLGEVVLAELRPAYDGLGAALARARTQGSSIAGQLTLGCTPAVDSRVLARLAAEYENHGRTLRISELATGSPYQALRAGQVDVLVWVRSGSAADLVFGPVVERQSAVVAMRAGHRLASRERVCLEDLADYDVIVPAYQGQPDGFAEDRIPSRTPTGRAIRRDPRTPSMLHEVTYDLARSDTLFPVVSGVARVYAHRTDLLFRPLIGIGPLDSVLIWLRDREDEAVRALARAAMTMNGSAS